MTNKYIFVFFFLITLLSSCKKSSIDKGVPSFIHIDKINFNAGFGQGSDSAFIADAWIYIDNKYIGTFELPATIPILDAGLKNITIKPGVIINGIAATRSIYPFMEKIDMAVNLIRDSIANLNLSTKYLSEAKFVWNSVGQEDFEQAGITIDSISGSSTNIIKSKLDVYEGDYSGLIHLDSIHNKFIAQSITVFDIPTNKNGTVMEINYKNPDNVFSIGIFFNLPGGTVSKVEYLFLNPSNKWKKIYVNFTELINQYSNAVNFKIFFSVNLSANLSQSNIFLDNVKLIHF